VDVLAEAGAGLVDLERKAVSAHEDPIPVDSHRFSQVSMELEPLVVPMERKTFCGLVTLSISLSSSCQP